MSEEPSDEFADESAAELTELVAYLDGELPETETASMEQRLIAETVLRQQAESLDKAWHLLDTIDDVSASREFTARTLASMPLSTEPVADSELPLTTVTTAGRPSVPVLSLVLWATVGFAITAIGLQVSRNQAMKRQDPETISVLQNMDFLKQYPKYRTVRNVESLKQLLEDPPEAAASSGDLSHGDGGLQ